MLKLGKVVATPGALASVPDICIYTALGRHMLGDWGNVCEEDKRLNDYAAAHGERVLSSYRSADGTKFWIITEPDRSYTTVLLPDEY